MRVCMHAWMATLAQASALGMADKVRPRDRGKDHVWRPVDTDGAVLALRVGG